MCREIWRCRRTEIERHKDIEIQGSRDREVYRYREIQRHTDIQIQRYIEAYICPNAKVL